ncbi:nuclear transport factor 2 family protein [Sphingomonas solaris]|uniref:Nuclear transport factor 2 family protein n=1 Tax=Alterirhizorhabdus solaris TaxID=2529389 RepID=A0A558RBD0_9SPHN|nr:nuclear transport factor 2 family protein [Sphingomonas solaris]TVV76715.1 nuclear transport factor 2 family protein [Sphingomonas solaris]
MTATNPIDRMYDAFATGDVDTIRACFTPDARVWHSFDGDAQDVATAAQAWEALFAHSQERTVGDIRRQATADGFVQQHMFALRLPSGERKAWAVCIVVRIENGLIARLDEYIDRAGALPVGEGTLATPGF